MATGHVEENVPIQTVGTMNMLIGPGFKIQNPGPIEVVIALIALIGGGASQRSKVYLAS